jgi:hypothetical protein
MHGIKRVFVGAHLGAMALPGTPVALQRAPARWLFFA